MSDLLPCPFCGSSDIASDGPSYTQFMCNACGSATYDQDSHAEAIAAWNRRPTKGEGDPAEIVRRWADWINNVSDEMEQPEWPTASRNSVLLDRDIVINSYASSQAEIERLRAALEPFVEILNLSEASALKDGRNPDNVPDTFDVLAFRNVPGLKLGAFRAARTALGTQPTGGAV